MQNRMRYLARFMVETNTPLSIGSGRGGLLNQRLVAKDANGLPYLPGTALAGVVRHELEQDEALQAQIDQLFGFQNGENGLGSRITFSSGHLLDENGQTVLEGLQNIDFSKAYFASFKRLPERDHVCITDRGVAKKHGKFEEELVHKGTRFVFEIEMEGTSHDADLWQQILNILNSEVFRIGAGTRKGFGQLKVLECQTRQFNLEVNADLMAYLSKSSALNAPIMGWDNFESTQTGRKWLDYTLELEASNFFLMGAGLGNENADMTPKKEKYFVWKPGGGVELKEHFLLPATSFKGAIAHRVAYHYNKLKGETIEKIAAQERYLSFDIDAALKRYQLSYPIEQIESSKAPEWQLLAAEIEAMDINQSEEWQTFLDQLQDEDANLQLLPIGASNNAIKALFGYTKAKKSRRKNNVQNETQNDEEHGARGKVIFSDFYLNPEKIRTKTLNHVALDRFTGGARDGALFTEEVSAFSDKIVLEMWVEEDAFVETEIKSAFEKTIEELCTGQLQLGGSTNKGHGVFTGSRRSEIQTR